MLNASLRTLLTVAVAVVVAGCASNATNTTNQVSTWRDPDFKGPPFRKVFVVGLSSKDLTDQRGFENLLVSTLQGAQIVAVPGWQYVAIDSPPDQATMRAAVAKSGADAVLLVRPSGFSTETRSARAGETEARSANMTAAAKSPQHPN